MSQAKQVNKGNPSKDGEALPPGAIDITSLPLPQLQAIRSQLEEELKHLTGSFTYLKQAQAKFSENIKSLEALPTSAQTSSTLSTGLVPLTNSLYVRATLPVFDEKTTLLVDVGTGYYVSKTKSAAQEFYERKVKYLQGNLDNLQQTIVSKQNSMSGTHLLFISWHRHSDQVILSVTYSPTFV
jgi:prefoldin alpha subunit